MHPRMLQLSVRGLVVGLAGAALLAIAANVFTLPAWSIYVAFVAILAVGTFVQSQDDERYERARLRSHPRPHQ